MDFTNRFFLPGIWITLIGGCVWWFYLSMVTAKEKSRFNSQTKNCKSLIWRLLFLTLITPLIAVGLAEPMLGEEDEIVFSRGNDLYFILDCSASMQVKDVPPSRTDASFFLAQSLIKELPNARVGLITFAGDSFPLCPLTFDSELVKTHLSRISQESSLSPGTDFNAPLRTLLRVITKQDKDRHLIVVLFSDGEYFHPLAPEIINKLKEKQLNFIIVGIGTTEGAPVPLPALLDKQDFQIAGKQVAISKLEEKKLMNLAEQLRGRYYRLATVGITLHNIMETLAKSNGSGFTLQRRLKNRTNQVTWLVFSSLLIFLFLPSFPKWSRGRKNTVLVLFLLLYIGCSNKSTVSIDEANQAVSSGNIRKAVADYQSIMQNTQLNSNCRSIAKINLTYTMVLTGNLKQAEKIAEEGLLSGVDDKHKSTLMYNLGCCKMLQQINMVAVETFRNVLELNPHDSNASWNLELCLKPESNPSLPEIKTPPTQDNTVNQFLDSLKDQEKMQLPKKIPQNVKGSEPYW